MIIQTVPKSDNVHEAIFQVWFRSLNGSVPADEARAQFNINIRQSKLNANSYPTARNYA